jgi:hypothetical protein
VSKKGVIITPARGLQLGSIRKTKKPLQKEGGGGGALNLTAFDPKKTWER